MRLNACANNINNSIVKEIAHCTTCKNLQLYYVRKSLPSTLENMMLARLLLANAANAKGCKVGYHRPDTTYCGSYTNHTVCSQYVQ